VSLHASNIQKTDVIDRHEINQQIG